MDRRNGEYSASLLLSDSCNTCWRCNLQQIGDASWKHLHTQHAKNYCVWNAKPPSKQLCMIQECLPGSVIASVHTLCSFPQAVPRSTLSAATPIGQVSSSTHEWQLQSNIANAFAAMIRTWTTARHATRQYPLAQDTSMSGIIRHG